MTMIQIDKDDVHFLLDEAVDPQPLMPGALARVERIIQDVARQERQKPVVDVPPSVFVVREEYMEQRIIAVVGDRASAEALARVYNLAEGSTTAVVTEHIVGAITAE